MTIPRFKLRTLVLCVVLVAMALAIGVLTVQNQRLRAEAERERAERNKATLAPFIRFAVDYRSERTKVVPTPTTAPDAEM